MLSRSLSRSVVDNCSVIHHRTRVRLRRCIDWLLWRVSRMRLTLRWVSLMWRVSRLGWSLRWVSLLWRVSLLFLLFKNYCIIKIIRLYKIFCLLIRRNKEKLRRIRRNKEKFSPIMKIKLHKKVQTTYH